MSTKSNQAQNVKMIQSITFITEVIRGVISHRLYIQSLEVEIEVILDQLHLDLIYREIQKWEDSVN